MKKRFCIVIPVYKKRLTDSERLSIETVIKKFPDDDIFFATFQGKHLKTYQQYAKCRYAFFPHKYFKNLQGYNRLMLNPFFYLKFVNYQYILIIQNDALILGDKKDLTEIMSKNYDYVGAPWDKGISRGRFCFDQQDPFISPKLKYILEGKKITAYVGNGGLSLRKPFKMCVFLLTHILQAATWSPYANEDTLFARYGFSRFGIHVADISTAKKFSLETTAKYEIEKGNIPFGIHAWQKFYPEAIHLMM